MLSSDFDVITGPSVPHKPAPAPSPGASAPAVTRHVLVTTRLALLSDRPGA